MKDLSTVYFCTCKPMITVQTAKSLTTISVAKVLPGHQPISLGPRPGFRYAATLKDYNK